MLASTLKTKESEIALTQDVINCPACSRRTPAARGACMYCGASLPVVEIHSAPHQRNIEPHELAFNTILLPSDWSDDASAAMAVALAMESDQARAYLAANKPLPVARSQTRQEAEMISLLIRNCGLGAMVVADEDLKLETPLARARRITRADDTLEIHLISDAIVVAASEIKLLVVGALRSVRIDYTEVIARGNARKEGVLDTSEFISEETLLDVYAETMEQSFRIKADAFDYSSFVEKLSFRAEENFQAVIKGLCEAAPQARMDGEFARVSSLLSRAWPERSHTEAHGIKRTGASYRPVAKSSVMSDNRDQFERYSRLMFLNEKLSGFRAR
ncbi:MAG: hypothetical protein AB1631_18380 [Acidobacteriota bacterium]